MIADPQPDDGRPQFHFTAPKGWLNDPNGLVYRDGQYHLFFQHNPLGTQWGNMTWGHAVSRDLIHWKDLPHALVPDAMGTMFSGSAVVDKDGVAGFGKNAIVCFYTAAGGTNEASKGQRFTQCLAYSMDGRTFTKFDGNPIVRHVAAENRDPKVVWHAPSKQWVMALYLEGQEFGFWGSTNLKDWKPLSRFSLAGSAECPDLFEMPLDGDKGKPRWVFWGANGLYQVGDFDGTRFVPETKVLRAVWGNTAYAAQTYSNAPKGRVVQVSWFSGAEFPGKPWNQQMGFPNELQLRSTPTGPTLTLWPVEEIRSVHGPDVQPVGSFYPVASGLVDVEGTWDVGGNAAVSFTVNGVDVTFDPGSRQLKALGKESTVGVPDGRLKLRVLADRASLEVYAQDGAVFMPFNTSFRQGASRGVTLRDGKLVGRLKVREVRVRPGRGE